MTSTLGGDDPLHDLPGDEKDRMEKRLRQEGKVMRDKGKRKEGNKKYITEIQVNELLLLGGKPTA